MFSKALSLGLIVIVASAAGCTAGFIDPPEGYIELDHGCYQQRFISADHNVIAVRVVDNPKGGTLDFWAKAVCQELTGSAGYELRGATDIRAGRLAGRLFEFDAAANGDKHVYLLAVFATDRRVVLVEAGGRDETIAADREKLLAAICSIR